jgi:hypothetical protein
VIRVPGTRGVALALVCIFAAACGAGQEQAAPHARAKLLLERKARGETGALYPERPTTYVLDGALPDLGSDAPVRRLKGHAVAESDVARFADALGLHGAPARTATGFEVRDGDAILTVDTSGTTTLVEFSDNAGSASGGASSGAGSGSAGSIGGSTGPGASDTATTEPAPSTTTLPPPVDVPSESEAREMAQALLDGFGVLIGQEWSSDVTDAGGVAVACPEDVECPPTPSYVTARSVDFRLVIDDAPVQAIDWIVTIGEHRRIQSVSGTWAEPETIGSYALRSTNDVFDDLRHGRAQFVGPQPLEAASPETAPVEPEPVPAVEVHVTGVTLGAARWEGSEDGRAVVYIVPTYRFRARVEHGEPYEIEVLALDPAVVGFMTEAVPTSMPKGVPVPDPAALP